ncbi:MAG: serine protease [Thermoanaerobaculia bacterium]|nr:serine protease [Thermoanaerobaculia bacterium]
MTLLGLRSVLCRRSSVSAAAVLAGIHIVAAPCAADELPTGPPAVGHAVPYTVAPGPTALAAAAQGVWSETVQMPGATFIKPHFVGLELEAGDELVVRSASGRVVERLTGRGPKDRGTFWGLSGFGDLLTLEFRFRGEYDELPFRIDQVIVGDRDLWGGNGGSGLGKSVCAPADFDDVACYDDDPVKWANARATVGVLTVSGDPAVAIFCSGSNVSPDSYVLTNDHCLSGTGTCPQFGSCAAAEFIFRYYRAGCNDGSPIGYWESFHCDEVVASSPCVDCDSGLGDLDFALASVIGDPASTYGWIQPDPVPLTDGEAIYVIQHPNGRPQEIAHGSGADVDVDGTVIRYYGTLDTQPGSSGSPVLRESDGKMVGLHHCGGCETASGNRGVAMSDIFPHIAPWVVDPTSIFEDGFESGDTTFWSVLVDRALRDSPTR